MQKLKPSRLFLDNINMYKQMHDDGYTKTDGGYIDRDNSFNGISTIPYAPIIKKIIDKNDLHSLLDYGCGKAEFYYNNFVLDNLEYPPFKKFWDINIDLYDPGYEKYNNLDTKKKYDIVICIDVLEHIPAEDIDYIFNKLSNLSKKYIFLNGGCYRAAALLPNGKNAHINIQTPEWWYKKILKIIKIRVDLKIICNCTIEKNGKLKVFPLQFNDKINNYI